MKTNLFVIILTCCFVNLFGTVENSAAYLMDQAIITDLATKTNQLQQREIQNCPLDLRLRVMSLNMLLNWSESHLNPVDRWENRKSRMAEYLSYAHPDIIGTQELRANQLDDVYEFLKDRYDYYGTGAIDGKREGDNHAIFYRKDRFRLVKGKTFYFSETPDRISESPFGTKNTFTFCQFEDKFTGNQFVVINTHLAFRNIERRYYEAKLLHDFILQKKIDLPLIITGDFNTFPFRQQLDLPAYDGDLIVSIIEQAGVIDSMKSPIFGHFGPIASTNYCEEKKQVFCSEGTPGVILDHIFVNDQVKVVAHGIDSARVDGHYPSDHFPVIADIIFPARYQQFVEYDIDAIPLADHFPTVH